jgi:hypothetical protein
VDDTDSGSCLMAGLGTSGFKPSGFTTKSVSWWFLNTDFPWTRFYLFVLYHKVQSIRFIYPSAVRSPLIYQLGTLTLIPCHGPYDI